MKLLLSPYIVVIKLRAWLDVLRAARLKRKRDMLQSSTKPVGNYESHLSRS